MKMTLESSKYMGGVGALLLVICGIGMFGTPFVGLLGIVGLILVLVALHGLANIYGERGIFNNALYAFIAAIVGIAAFVGTLIVAFLSFVSNLPSWMRPFIEANDWQGLSNAFQQHFADFTNFTTFWADFGWLIITVILAIIVLFVFFVITFFFFRRSLGLLSAKTHVGLFGTAGLLMLIGAILTIILFGLFLIWIGFILLTVAFFSIHETAPSQPTQTVAPPATQ